mgnify:CR=1 FL=1
MLLRGVVLGGLLGHFWVTLGVGGPSGAFFLGVEIWLKQKFMRGYARGREKPPGSSLETTLDPFPEALGTQHQDQDQDPSPEALKPWTRTPGSQP